MLPVCVKCACLLQSVDVNVSGATWLPVGGLIGYGVAFSIGLSPIPAALLGEMFPAHLKGLAACSAAISLSIASLVVTKLYQVKCTASST